METRLNINNEETMVEFLQQSSHVVIYLKICPYSSSLLIVFQGYLLFY